MIDRRRSFMFAHYASLCLLVTNKPCACATSPLEESTSQVRYSEHMEVALSVENGESPNVSSLFLSVVPSTTVAYLTLMVHKVGTTSAIRRC